MAFVAGDYSAAALYTNVVKMLKDMWSDATVHKTWKTPMPLVSNVAGNQSSFNLVGSDPLADPRNCQTIKTIWLDTPAGQDVEVIDPNEFCDWTGPEGSVDEQDYAVGAGFQIPFSVKENACNDRFSYEQKTAEALGDALYKADLEVEKRFSAFLTGNSDDISGVDPGFGIYTGGPKVGTPTIWEVPTAEGFTVINHMSNFATDQFMNDPVFVAGNKWRHESAVFAAKSGDCCDDRNLLLQSSIPFLRSTHIHDAVVGSQDIFILDRSGVGFYNMTYHKNDTPIDERVEERVFTMRIRSPRHTWRNPVSNQVEPVYYDMRMKRKCTGRHEWTTFYMIEGLTGWLKAPQGAEAKPTVVRTQFA